MPRQTIDLSKRKFGKLIVLSHGGYYCNSQGKRLSLWECQCRCGAIVISKGHDLRRGCVTQCRECTAEAHRTHGMTGTKEYCTWRGIRRRCFNVNDNSYPHYGGRGLVVCRRWDSLFEAFFEDMGPAPTNELSIDRIDNAIGYTCGKCSECAQNQWPANCRWATAQQQSDNSSVPRWIEVGGDRLSLAGWAKKLGISREAMRLRVDKCLREGTSLAHALAEPAKRYQAVLLQ